jgi:hypothetical protein
MATDTGATPRHRSETPATRERQVSGNHDNIRPAGSCLKRRISTTISLLLDTLLSSRCLLLLCLVATTALPLSASLTVVLCIDSQPCNMSEDPAAKLERLRADMAKTKERIAAIRASHNNMTPVNGDQPAGMLLLSLSLSLSLSLVCVACCWYCCVIPLFAS